MTTDYVGNPATSHGVTLPSLDNAVAIKHLVDLLDPLNASAIHGGSVTVLADWVEFLKREINTLYGCRLWEASRTYPAGSMAVELPSGRIFRAVSESTNVPPSHDADGTYWEQCDLSRNEIRAFTAAYTAGSGAAGITCTRGASVVSAHMVNTENTLRQIMLVIQGIPLDNSIEVDLSDSDIKFLSLFYGGTVSPRSNAWMYAPRLGLNQPQTGHDVFTIYAAKHSSDPSSTCTASVMLWGV